MRYGLFLTLLSVCGVSIEADLVINEIAPSGSGEDTCAGEDWIELLNTGEEVLDLSDYILHDDKGKDDVDAMIFENTVPVSPREFLLLCQGVDFEFGIGKEDTVTLLNGDGILVDSVALPGSGSNKETYAFIDGEYKYTTTPTAGAANVYTEPLSFEEQLLLQNEIGNDFFLKTDAPTFGKVVDVSITMDDDDLSVIDDHPVWAVNVPFSELSVSNSGSNTVAAVSSGGRIRPKGQSTLMNAACRGFSNIPFQISFNNPFLGMETMYLRNHFDDPSYLKEHGNHLMLEAFGMPYLRTRPARLFINGVYRGFYLLMEAPTQGYVMQRSFGAFDLEKTSLYKVKTNAAWCPFNPVPGSNVNFWELAKEAIAANSTIPQNYRFERGAQRGDLTNCDDFYGVISDMGTDVARGLIQEYDGNCSSAMVKLGRVDFDYGTPMDESMIAFLDKYFDDSVDDLNDYVDTDQWLQNFAIYAITSNYDSPLGGINNFYLATTEAGAGDWKIVPYDHNTQGLNVCPGLVGMDTCGTATFRSAYMPILRPTCSAVKDHPLVGRVLNSEENVLKYLGYVQEYANILVTGGVLDKLYEYGEGIKEYIVDDPWFSSLYNTLNRTLEEYEEVELGRDTQDYNTGTFPFLKGMKVRLGEIQKQLDAIKDGSIPLEDRYDPSAICPDWRDSNSENYIPGTFFTEDCKDTPCVDNLASTCFSHTSSCLPDGEFGIESCNVLTDCMVCYPHSRCGTLVDHSNIFVESESCGPEIAETCTIVAPCFDHKSGYCDFLGEMIPGCRAGADFCKGCYPYSRCGSGEISPEVDDPINDPIDDAIDESTKKIPEENETAVASAASTAITVSWTHLLGLMKVFW